MCTFVDSINTDLCVIYLLMNYFMSVFVCFDIYVFSDRKFNVSLSNSQINWVFLIQESNYTIQKIEIIIIIIFQCHKKITLLASASNIIMFALLNLNR